MLTEALAVLQRVYGYTSFRGGQAHVVEYLLSRADTLAIMPTGAGKSICYQVPALLFPGMTLVISPLIALMKDQVDALAGLGIPSTFINSTLKSREMKKRLLELAAGRYKLVYVAPERLFAEGFLELVSEQQISFIAIDEAHCVSQWGHDFRPSYRKISEFIKKLSSKPLIGAFTATATTEVKEDIIRLLGLTDPKIVVTGFDRKNLELCVLRGENKKDYTLNYVSANRGRSGIIYTATRNDADSLTEFLQKNNIVCGKYHAGMKEAERTESQEAFLRDDVPVMIATNAFGMGIDKSNVRYVIHYSLPKNLEAYYQEAGRAGRDGEPAECILLYHPQDVVVQKFLIEQSVYFARRKHHELTKLQQVVDYCHTSKCLRQVLLEYFGDPEATEYCGNCCNCRDDRVVMDITVDTQKILSCVYRMKERYGAAMVAQVLKGSNNKKTRLYKLDKLSTFGIMQDKSMQEIRDLIGYLTAEGYLKQSEGKFPLLKLGPDVAPVMRGQVKMERKVAVRQERNEDVLFELLRLLRKEIADREDIPPYLVFSDATLRQLCEQRPGDLNALRSISGIGDIKLEKYGAAFLDVIKKT